MEPNQMMKLSDFARISQTEDGNYEIGTRADAGRGKRFGMTGKVTLSRDELDALAKWYVEHRYPFVGSADTADSLSA